ncbi:hypothetical protein O6P43_003812 [Quillaja saponaria]|uniref:Uncharacterized protein n=1 Tax=Quillaja saponaria TaxID=32244 RepID=A0AAD7QFJ6_QUISA|nr:hypothetical protein O6P43_003812 [Quillaja saponaria]
MKTLKLKLKIRKMDNVVEGKAKSESRKRLRDHGGECITTYANKKSRTTLPDQSKKSAVNVTDFPGVQASYDSDDHQSSVKSAAAAYEKEWNLFGYETLLSPKENTRVQELKTRFAATILRAQLKKLQCSLWEEKTRLNQKQCETPVFIHTNKCLLI